MQFVKYVDKVIFILYKLIKIFRSAHITDGSCTMFTQRNDKGKISHLDDRPALLISSTSWTGKNIYIYYFCNSFQ